MSTARLSHWRLPLLAAVVLALGCIALAVDGRDFAGRYDLRNEVESGETVSMTFTTEIYNYSGADVSGATVRLENRADNANPHATFTSVNIVANARTRLAASVSVATREWDSWRRGATPLLTVEFLDTTGNTIRRPVPLRRAVLAQEAQP